MRKLSICTSFTVNSQTIGAFSICADARFESHQIKGVAGVAWFVDKEENSALGSYSHKAKLSGQVVDVQSQFCSGQRLNIRRTRQAVREMDIVVQVEFVCKGASNHVWGIRRALLKDKDIYFSVVLALLQLQEWAVPKKLTCL